MAVEQFLLKWNNHQSNFVDVFGQLYDQEAFTDVTLAADGRTFEAHKIVLSACSPYLRHILSQNPCRHPVVILRGVSWLQLHTLLQYIYRGETHVSQQQLPDLLRTASDLQIKGLASVAESGASGHASGGGRSGVIGDQETRSPPPPLSSDMCSSSPCCSPVRELGASTGSISALFPSPPLSTPSKLALAGCSSSMSAVRLDLSASPPASPLPASQQQQQQQQQQQSPCDREGVSIAASQAARALVTDMASVSVGANIGAPLSPGSSSTKIKYETEPLSSLVIDEAVASGSGQQVSKFSAAGVSVSEASGVTGSGQVSDMTEGSLTSAAALRRLHLPAKKGPYKCRFCGETFKAKEHLNRHERIHTGERPFPCGLCGKRFSRKDHLKIHLLIHTGEKPFHCSMCSKRFTQKQTLIEHENVHLGRRPFHCDLCDAAFPARGNLKYHRRSVHGCTLSGAPSRAASGVPTVGGGDSSVLQARQLHDMLQLQLNQQLLAAAAAAAVSEPPATVAPPTSSAADL